MRGVASAKPCPPRRPSLSTRDSGRGQSARADTHKRSHTVAAVAATTGELAASRPSQSASAGLNAPLRWARKLDDERVWALEDSRHVSGSLERWLIERGERVLRIPTHLSAKELKRSRQRGKSDAIDALNVARAALQEGLGTFRAGGSARRTVPS